MDILAKLAKAVWNCKDVEKAKLALHEMVNAFEFKEKQDKFRIAIDRETKLVRLYSLAANIVNADQKVIK